MNNFCACSSETFRLELFDGFPNLVWHASESGRHDFFNRAWVEFTGLTPDALAQGDWLSQAHPEDRDRLRQAWKAAVACKNAFNLEYRLRRKDGAYRWIACHVVPQTSHDGAFAGFLGLCCDISESKHYETELEYHSSHDLLTGLPNRTLLAEHLGHALKHAKKTGNKVAVIFLDIDGFKHINDSLGHDAGDILLADIAERLETAIGDGDTVARHSGDEFVIVQDNIASQEKLLQTIQNIKTALRPPFLVHSQEIFITASLGISVYPNDGKDAKTLLKNADTAMYRAKEEGRDNFQFYAAGMNIIAFERFSMENSLRHSIEIESFVVYYQPQVDLHTGVMTGMEALLRWRHPELGLVPPSKFIPLAEESGLIVELGEWVLRQACAQNAAWQRAGLPRLTMAVNVSSRQFAHPGLLGKVSAILRETGLEPRHLELELTESVIMHDPERAIEILGRLSDMGIRLAVDDFGTGYSSLGYLKRFPIDKVKIDQSFVHDITTDPDDAAIAKAVISIAHDMKMRVIAEGVETENQALFLRNNHCDEMQGFYFGKPLSAEDMENCLRSGQRQHLHQEGEHPPRTLLVVDDEENVLSSLTRLFHQDGYRILSASSAQEALELLPRHRVGVIISDQRMPQMSGVEFLRRVRQLYPDIVRIILSGYTELASVTSAVNEGAVYKFLIKPWDNGQLRDNIREAFQHFEMKQENVRLARELTTANLELSIAKKELEQEVDEKTQEALRNLHFLNVSQETLESLPVAVAGIGDDGMIAIANQAAERLFSREDGDALIGSQAARRLPPEMLDAIASTRGGQAAVSGQWRTAGHIQNFWCSAMGFSSLAKGVTLVVAPSLLQAPGDMA